MIELPPEIISQIVDLIPFSSQRATWTSLSLTHSKLQVQARSRIWRCLSLYMEDFDAVGKASRKLEYINNSPEIGALVRNVSVSFKIPKTLCEKGGVEAGDAVRDFVTRLSGLMEMEGGPKKFQWYGPSNIHDRKEMWKASTRAQFCLDGIVASLLRSSVHSVLLYDDFEFPAIPSRETPSCSIENVKFSSHHVLPFLSVISKLPKLTAITLHEKPSDLSKLPAVDESSSSELDIDHRMWLRVRHLDLIVYSERTCRAIIDSLNASRSQGRGHLSNLETLGVKFYHSCTSPALQEELLNAFGTREVKRLGVDFNFEQRLVEQTHLISEAFPNVEEVILDNCKGYPKPDPRTGYANLSHLGEHLSKLTCLQLLTLERVWHFEDSTLLCSFEDEDPFSEEYQRDASSLKTLEERVLAGRASGTGVVAIAERCASLRKISEGWGCDWEVSRRFDGERRAEEVQLRPSRPDSFFA